MPLPTAAAHEQSWHSREGTIVFRLGTPNNYTRNLAQLGIHLYIRRRVTEEMRQLCEYRTAAQPAGKPIAERHRAFDCSHLETPELHENRRSLLPGNYHPNTSA